MKKSETSTARYGRTAETEKLLHLAGALAAVSGVFTLISLAQKRMGRGCTR